MHSTFTGQTRRPRHVNLSGRNQNPWASLPGSNKPTQSNAGTHNAVAQAHAERLRRAHERDRLTAAKKVQRVWRGHASRQVQRQVWREEWDAQEQARLHLPKRIRYDDVKEQDLAHTPYPNEEFLLSQLRLIVTFMDYKNALDRMRLAFFGSGLEASWTLIRISPLSSTWRQYFRKLQRSIARTLDATTSHTNVKDTQQILRLGRSLCEHTDAGDQHLELHGLRRILELNLGDATNDIVGGYAIALLQNNDLSTYDAFVQQILTRSIVPISSAIRTFVLTKESQLEITAAIRRLPESCSSLDLMWILANTVWLWHSVPANRQITDWTQAISVVLGRVANLVSERIDVIDEPMTGTNTDYGQTPLDPFVRQQISSLAQQESVHFVMSQIRSTQASVSEVAKPLANYAVALLRAFPTRATNIRMWLYRNSPNEGSSSSRVSTIQYLWKATQSTSVFQKIRSDQRITLSVLIEAAPPSNQFNKPPLSPSDIAEWQEEWRIILLFLELYTFILKLMDDEEFFALDDRLMVDSGVSRPFRQGALPLGDVASLGNFLKNLAFSLYWNAAELTDYNEIEEAGGLAVLFGNANVPAAKAQVKQPRTLTGNDVSAKYLKDLSTGLVRMLHERDSRRKFLPEGYWLMTKQFDLQGFIPAVVDEEERRHQAIDDADEDDLRDALRFGNGDMGDDDDEIPMPTVGTLFGIRAPHMPRSQTSQQAERRSKEQERAKRKRQAQSLAPRLEILRNLPFFIPFETRVQIFRRFVFRDQERRRNGFVEPDDWRMSVAASHGRDISGRPRGMELISRHHANIRRELVFDDAFQAFYELGEALKEPIQISFIDKFGAPEAGIDGGGVTKEFLMSVTDEAFDPKAEMSMFEENEQRFLYPKPTFMEHVREELRSEGHFPNSESFTRATRHILQQWEFLGRIVGKCMYEGILIDVNFAGFFLLKWALTGGTTTATHESAYRASINDLRDFDEQLYQGLLKLKNYVGDVESDFGLNFTVTDTFEVGGRSVNKTIELKRSGANIAVTNLNRLEYIDKITRYRLQEQPRAVTNAFLRGLGQIISPMWLAMFNQKELQKLVGGDNTELDIADLRQNTQYGGLYVIGDDGLEHPTVALFWKVLKDMDDEDRRKILKFVTSTPRAPLLGFSHLNPKFSIRDSSEDQTRLPSTSTCVNLLKLPRYSDEKTMREKLLYAANSGAGFDLS